MLSVYTPLISDLCDELGVGPVAIDRTIQQVLADPQLVVSGTAFCCIVEPTDEYVEIDAILAMVDEIPEGAFVLVSTEGEEVDAALWGGLMSARAMARGAVAAAVTGDVRDVAQIDRLGFPVFARGRNMKDIRRRGRMVSWGVEATVGDVTVRTGDTLVGDANGIVRIPRDRHDEILARIDTARSEENAVESGLRDGRSAVDLFAENRRF